MRNQAAISRIVAIVVFCAGLSSRAGAQGVGAIGGSATDSSGAALPGVTVALSSTAGVIGGAQEAITDVRGDFQFNRLVPGTYSVRASLPGFKTVTERDTVVVADSTSRVDMKLEIGALEESIVVSGQSPLLDTTTAQRQTVLTRETIDALPARSNIWALARSV